MSENENITPETETEEAAAPADDTSPEAVIAELTAEIDTLRDERLRALADAQNTRRRAEKEISDARVYSVSNFAKDMLDVADNLSRALAALDPAQLDGASDGLKNLVEGIAMTEKSLLSKMERHGVKMIDPAPGDVFDPNRHQAVAQIPSDQPSGKIATVMQTGFVIGDRTLRAAMVAVSAGQPGGNPASESGGNLDVTA